MYQRALLIGGLVCLVGSSSEAADKKLVRRSLVISDSSANSISDIRVAGGISTTLVFQVPVREDGVILADRSGSLHPPIVMDKSVLVIPKRNIPRGKPRTLTVTLADGTVLPFRL